MFVWNSLFSVFFFCPWIFSFPGTIYRKIRFSLLNYFSTLVENKLAINIKVYFWAPDSILLIGRSILCCHHPARLLALFVASLKSEKSWVLSVHLHCLLFVNRCEFYGLIYAVSKCIYGSFTLCPDGIWVCSCRRITRSRFRWGLESKALCMQWY